MEKYLYRLYDLKLISDISFIELLPWDDGDIDEDLTADNAIRVVCGQSALQHDAYLSAFSARKMQAEINRDYVWFTNQYGGFEIIGGCDIFAKAYDDVNPIELNTFILGYCLAFAFWQRGEYAFHCSALYDTERKAAILVSGNSGAGKSTLSEKFLNNGCELMADDVSILEICENCVLAKAAYPQQKLCRDMVENGDFDPARLRYIDEQKDKFALLLDDGFHSSKEPICTIVFLSIGKNEKVEISEVRGLEKIKIIADNMFLHQAFEQEGVRFTENDMAAYLEIAGKMRIISVKRPKIGNTVDEIFERLQKMI